MADTMTLEELRESLDVGCLPNTDRPRWFAAIDAAIRERDRLRGDISGMTEELLRVPSREEWRELQKRAEKAEAELAALKTRIAGSSVVKIANYGDPFIVLPDHFTVPNSLKGKTVRLFVEE